MNNVSFAKDITLRKGKKGIRYLQIDFMIII